MHSIGKRGTSMSDKAVEDRLVERGMAIVRPLIARNSRIVRRAEEMYRDMTGATTTLYAAEMDETDRQWWYRLARISIEQDDAAEDAEDRRAR